MMYENLIDKLRDKAARYKFEGKVGLSREYTQAADAIEKMSKRIDFLMKCIYEAEDALDRGAYNDWAMAALEKAERGQDDV